MKTLQPIIEDTYKKINQINPENVNTDTKKSILETIALLDKGILRIAEKKDQHWIVHQWLKQAILLFFRITPNQIFDASYTQYFDKVPLKYAAMDQQQL